MSVRVFLICFGIILSTTILALAQDAEGARTCPGGWYMFHNSCYLYVSSKMNWDEAMANCRSMEGYLAEVYDRETDNFLIDMVGRHGTSGFGPWLGATDRASEGHWVWATSLKPVTYHNWYAGTTNGYTSENCLHCFQFTALQWNDASCTNWKFPSVCQRPS